MDTPTSQDADTADPRDVTASAAAPAAAAAVAAPAPAPPRRRRRSLQIVLVLAVLLAGGATLAWWRGRGEARISYVTAIVERGTVAPSVIASGTVNPVNTIQVGSYVSGVIQTLACDFNTRVRAGQLCARLDPRPYQSAVDQEAANLATARAQLQKDRANLAFAKLISERNGELFRRNIVSQETVDSAANAYAQASKAGMRRRHASGRERAQRDAASIGMAPRRAAVRSKVLRRAILILRQRAGTARQRTKHCAT